MNSNTQNLTLISAYCGNYFYGVLGYMIMKNRHEKIDNNLKEFREKQRELLFDYDLASYTRLKEEDFGHDIFWKVNDVYLLEESAYPVLIMESSKGKSLLIFADMPDLLIEKGSVIDLKEKYGDDILHRLFEGQIKFGWPINLIRYALGYESNLVSIEQTEKGINEIYAYQNLWLYLNDGKYYKQEWSYFRNPYSKEKTN